MKHNTGNIQTVEYFVKYINIKKTVMTSINYLTDFYNIIFLDIFNKRINFNKENHIITYIIDNDIIKISTDGEQKKENLILNLCNIIETIRYCGFNRIYYQGNYNGKIAEIRLDSKYNLFIK